MPRQAIKTKIIGDIRVLRDELYLNKVDDVNRLAILDEHGEIRTRAVEVFSERTKQRWSGCHD